MIPDDIIDGHIIIESKQQKIMNIPHNGLWDAGIILRLTNNSK